ncbi:MULTISPECIES: LPS biosynthesis choline kinase [unclassified Nocardioides]|uniref:LPS biosynthesis choline kinase n=1 Tax=unclassified Nocardioides TaxID=2615069 RepID=UPI003610C869
MGDAAPALDRLACLAGRSWRVSDLPGGLTNRNLHVVTDDGDLDLVVRWSLGDATLLGIDRDAEAANTASAAEAGAGPRVVEYRPELSLLVIEFLPGHSLEDPDFDDPEVLRRAAEANRRLHAGPRFAGGFDMFARQATYLRTLREQGYWLPPEYDDHAPAWSDVRRALTSTHPPTVPCNNDLLAANFIDDGTQVWLIDYEYSGNNDPCFELGNTATECNFSADQVEAYAAAYFGTLTRADLARVRLQMLCSEYGWALWGFIQAAASPIDFDFRQWGLDRFEKAAATFGSPALKQLLEDVAT